MMIGSADETVRVDLHLHSRASGSATNVWVKGLGDERGVRESYTLPEESYRMAKRAGMDFVTLTDHETIDVALTLLHHPDFLVGEEVSARFPEDGSYADILLYGLDARSHVEVQDRRESVYDLVGYLREAGIVHVLAHPMYSITKPLDRVAVEKRLVLFGLWEFVNGSRPASQNRLARVAAENVGPLDLRQMALRNGLGAPYHMRIAGTGGSDDHGGIYGGSTFTLIPRVTSREDLLEAIAAGESEPEGEDGSVGKVAHTALRLAGASLEEGKKGRAARILGRIDLPPRVLRLVRGAPTADENKLLRYVPILAKLDEAQIRSALASRYEDHIALALKNSSLGFPALDFLSSLGDFVDGHVFISPYIAAHGYFGRENKKTFELRDELDLCADRRDLEIGVFVDGMDSINGVSTMYRSIQALAPERLRVVRCGAGREPGTVSLRSVATLGVPLYDGLDLGVPSFLDVVDHIAREEYDSLHVATPGPLGLAALLAGLLLGIPVVGAYHTEFGDYARALSGDAFVAEIVEVAVREFYERCSVVAVPSQATALALRNRGYRIQTFEFLRNGVDTDLFTPRKREPDPREFLGTKKTLLLYVGRVSKEKGLERLLHRYLDLRSRRKDVHLVVVGDGPYREEMESALGREATFTGFLQGEALACLFAYCDIFVFPSATDTLGRAVVEAQASGLPAVVYDIGGPGECIRSGETGFAVAFGDEREFFDKLELLVDDVALRRRMGFAAREFATTLSWRAVLQGVLDIHLRLAEGSVPPRVPAES
jgi:glycosyltransferase involved in cell wall biosynthesis